MISYSLKNYLKKIVDRDFLCAATKPSKKSVCTLMVSQDLHLRDRKIRYDGSSVPYDGLSYIAAIPHLTNEFHCSGAQLQRQTLQASALTHFWCFCFRVPWLCRRRRRLPPSPSPSPLPPSPRPSPSFPFPAALPCSVKKARPPCPARASSPRASCGHTVGVASTSAAISPGTQNKTTPGGASSIVPLYHFYAERTDTG